MRQNLTALQGDTYIVANIIGQIDKKWKQWDRVILVTP